MAAVRPTIGSLATARAPLPVAAGLVALVPDCGLRPGTVVGISGRGGVSSLLLSLLAPPLAQGSWAVVVGIPELGLEAAAEIGVSLDRLALVPEPGERWVDTVAGLVDAFDLVVFRPLTRCSPSLARRLVARGRERGCVLIVATPDSVARTRAVAWPEPVEVALEVAPDDWWGLHDGYGTLLSRRLTVHVFGRRIAKERWATVVLPGDGAATASSSILTTPRTVVAAVG